jgi:hypothetical protein
MKKIDIECYRINYNRKDWGRIIENGFQVPNQLFSSATSAIEVLCKEIERLYKIIDKEKCKK